MWLLCSWHWQSIVKCFGANRSTNGQSRSAGLSCYTADVEHVSPFSVVSLVTTLKWVKLGQPDFIAKRLISITEVTELCLCLLYHFKLFKYSTVDQQLIVHGLKNTVCIRINRKELTLSLTFPSRRHTLWHWKITWAWVATFVVWHIWSGSLKSKTRSRQTLAQLSLFVLESDFYSQWWSHLQPRFQPFHL